MGQKRLTPDEISWPGERTGGAGTSGAQGIQTIILQGDPTKPGLYTIRFKDRSEPADSSAPTPGRAFNSCHFGHVVPRLRWPPAVFASLHGVRPTRFALSGRDKANDGRREGCASPAAAALDPARRLPVDDLVQGEALFRIARTQSSLLSLWSEFQARNPGSGGPWQPKNPSYVW